MVSRQLPRGGARPATSGEVATWCALLARGRAPMADLVGRDRTCSSCLRNEEAQSGFTVSELAQENGSSFGTRVSPPRLDPRVVTDATGRCFGPLSNTYQPQGKSWLTRFVSSERSIL